MQSHHEVGIKACQLILALLSHSFYITNAPPKLKNVAIIRQIPLGVARGDLPRAID